MACYFLLVELEAEVDIPVGKKGVQAFSRGWYLYVGRARRGLAQRLARHLRREKRCRWHIDFLLQSGWVRGVVILESDKECSLAAFLRNHPLAQAWVPGFGSSDCRCPSHLIVWGEDFDRKRFLTVLEELPCSFQMILEGQEFLGHPGITDGIVPEAIVEHEKDLLGSF